jgi:hypothetical protein
MYMYIYMYTRTYTCIHMYNHIVCLFDSFEKSFAQCVCIDICIYICICIYLYVYMYIYIYSLSPSFRLFRKSFLQWVCVYNDSNENGEKQLLVLTRVRQEHLCIYLHMQICIYIYIYIYIYIHTNIYI